MHSPTPIETRALLLVTVTVAALGWTPVRGSDDPSLLLNQALATAGSNRAQLEAALRQIPGDQKRGLEYLITHMPQRDLESRTAEYLIENVSLAYEAWRGVPWRARAPESIFLNEILPFASINERRDRWRPDFYKRFKPLVEGAPSAAAAAVILNQQVFDRIGVKYSTERSKPDQSPYESMEIGMASCTGLSIILVNACRAVGIPARFVGTPRWSDGSGNHSWVEVWDGRWHYTGAAEPTGNDLDKSWFAARASQAKHDDPQHAIFATSFRRTPLRFPLVWSPEIKDVFAVNETHRYATQEAVAPAGQVRVRFRVLDGTGTRRGVALTIRAASGEDVFEGTSKGAEFDANDHLTVLLEQGKAYQVTLGESPHPSRGFTADHDELLVTLPLPPQTRRTEKF